MQFLQYIHQQNKIWENEKQKNDVARFSLYIDAFPYSKEQ